MENKMIEILQNQINGIKDAREFGLNDRDLQLEFNAQRRMVEMLLDKSVVVKNWKVTLEA